MWEFLRFSYGMGMGMTLSLWVFPHVGFCGFSHRNPVGMGIEILFPWQPCEVGNIYSQYLFISLVFYDI